MAKKKTSKRLRLREIFPGVLLLTCQSQTELGAALVRPQEYYENPTYKGKAFSLSEFKRHYRLNNYSGKKTSFTYLTDVLGYNMPGEVLKALAEGKIGPPNARERRLLSMIRRRVGPRPLEDFYLIGLVGHEAEGEERLRTLAHEIAHALFRSSAEYRRSAKRAVSLLPETVGRRARALIKRLLYHDSVTTDEIQALVVEHGLISHGDTNGLRAGCLPTGERRALWKISRDLREAFLESVSEHRPEMADSFRALWEKEDKEQEGRERKARGRRERASLRKAA